MDEFATITPKQWAEYERIVDELSALKTSDTMQLKQVWEANYITVCKFDDEGARPLFRRLVGMKDFLKEKCLAGSMEAYHRGQVKALGKSVYRRVWRQQLSILSNKFLENGSKQHVANIDNLRARLLIYKNETEGFEKMSKRLELDVFAGGYQVIEVQKNGADVVIGSFEQLQEAEREMQALLNAQMLASPEKFGFEEVA